MRVLDPPLLDPPFFLFLLLSQNIKKVIFFPFIPDIDLGLPILSPALFFTHFFVILSLFLFLFLLINQQKKKCSGVTMSLRTGGQGHPTAIRTLTHPPHPTLKHTQKVIQGLHMVSGTRCPAWSNS